MRSFLKSAFVLFIVACICSCQHEKTSDPTDTTSIDSSGALMPPVKRSGLSCEASPTKEELQHLQGLMNEIRRIIDSMDYCPSIPYSPKPCKPKDIGPECKIIFEDIGAYLSANQNRITYCVVNTSSWWAAVNINDPNPKIYVSTKFLKSNKQDEQLRSLIHELNHLQGNYTPHTSDKKQCIYFQHDALKSEHCTTCGVSYGPIEEFGCSSAADGIFILNK